MCKRCCLNILCWDHGRNSSNLLVLSWTDGSFERNYRWQFLWNTGDILEHFFENTLHSITNTIHIPVRWPLAGSWHLRQGHFPSFTHQLLPRPCPSRTRVQRVSPAHNRWKIVTLSLLSIIIIFNLFIHFTNGTIFLHLGHTYFRVKNTYNPPLILSLPPPSPHWMKIFEDSLLVCCRIIQLLSKIMSHFMFKDYIVIDFAKIYVE